MSYFDRIETCNRHDLTGARPFLVAGQQLGWVKPEIAKELTRFDKVFDITGNTVTLAEQLDTPSKRTEAVAEVVKTLHDDRFLDRWVGEAYRVSGSFAEEPAFLIERAAVPLFGIIAYGIHVNGFVRTKGGIKMWIGRRADDRIVSPGKFDQMVAGGQPADLTLEENLIKECAEEAGLTPDMALTAQPIGAISYCLDHPHGLRRDVLFNYDLELPEGFTPVCADGEMAGFVLLTLDEVAAIARETDDFKFNCSLVVIDFLIRHGYLKPDHPEYLALVNGLHRL